MNLPKLTSEDIIYENAYGYDRLYSKLILTDTDWMNYKLKAKFHTIYGSFYLVFEFSGADHSTMQVVLQKGKHQESCIYEYSTDLFEKYIIQYFVDQIHAWKTESVFYAETLVLNFYNEILTSSSECSSLIL